MSVRASVGVTLGGRVLIVTQLHVADMAIGAITMVVTAIHAKTVMAVLIAKQKISVIVTMAYGTIIWMVQVIANVLAIMAGLIAEQLMQDTIYATIMVIGIAVNVPAIPGGRVLIVTQLHVADMAGGAITMVVTAINAQVGLAVLIAQRPICATKVLGIIRVMVLVIVIAITVGMVISAINATDRELHIMPIRENAHAKPVIAVMIAKSKIDCFLV